MANLFDQFDGTLSPPTPEPEEEAVDFDQFDPRAQSSQQAAAAQEQGFSPTEFGQGVVQGGLDETQEMLNRLAGDPNADPQSISEAIAQIPGAAIDLMTGGKGGPALKRLDLGQYGPGVPATPSGQFGEDVAPVAVPVGAAGAAKGAGAVARTLRGDPAEAALVSQLSKSGSPRQDYADAIVGQPGATKGEARAKFSEMKQAEGFDAPVMSPLSAENVAGQGQTKYRAAMQDLIEERGDLLTARHKRELTSESMTVAQYVKIKRQIGALAKAPKNSMLETPMAAQKRGAYAAAARNLDEMDLPVNAAVKLYGEGADLWKSAKNYERARGLVDKHVKIGSNGERMFNAKTFQNELDAMDPKVLREVFGDKINRIVKASKRVTYRGYTSQARSKKRAQRSIGGVLYKAALLSGVLYAANAMMREGGKQIFGMGGKRPGQGGR